MYDIEFFKKSYSLKNDIIKGKDNVGSSEEIFLQLETYRNQNPVIFNFETTNNCNMSCVMCPRTSLMTRKITHISDDDFENALDQVKPHKPESLKKFWNFIKGAYGIQPDEQSENAFYFYVVSKCLTLHGYGEPMIDPNIINQTF